MMITLIIYTYRRWKLIIEVNQIILRIHDKNITIPLTILTYLGTKHEHVKIISKFQLCYLLCM